MIRPSGTEPKVRFYIEARTEEEKKAVFATAERITREALGGITSFPWKRESRIPGKAAL